MSIADKIRAKIDKMFHESPPEPIIHYGPFDAIWPTIGVGHYGWFCHWCGLPSQQIDTFPESRMGAVEHSIEHAHEHPNQGFQIIEAKLDLEGS